MENLQLTQDEKATLGLLSEAEVKKLAEETGRPPTASEMLKYDIGVGAPVCMDYVKMYKKFAETSHEEITADDIMTIHAGFLHILLRVAKPQMEETAKKIVKDYLEYRKTRQYKRLKEKQDIQIDYD